MNNEDAFSLKIQKQIVLTNTCLFFFRKQDFVSFKEKVILH